MPGVMAGGKLKHQPELKKVETSGLIYGKKLMVSG
jgi:hypothetical protein